MAFKQPRVPEYLESEGTGKYLRSLVLFLKDFCMDVWTANNQRSGEISEVRKGYPVSSVCGKTGDVTLTAGDVGARPGSWMPTAGDVGALAQGGTAADSSKLGGRTWDEHLLDIYPIGSIYMSAGSASPASLFGGTWEQLQDRFLLGAGSTYSAGSTGGEVSHKLTSSEIPSHYHDAYLLGLGGTVDAPAFYAVLNQSAYTYNYANTTPNTMDSAATAKTGGGAAHNNMPPYLAVYMWKRVS